MRWERGLYVAKTKARLLSTVATEQTQARKNAKMTLVR
jgi:hypothetical protein